jgi:hypothetical protein
MLTKVEVRNPAGDLLTLELEDISDGLILADVDGLDPVKATLVSSSFATVDGAQYQSARREPRNILLTIGLEPDYTVDTIRDLRKRLYPFFMTKSRVTLKFFDSDGLEVEIEGRVESFDTPLFSKEPEVSISIICFDPDLIDMEEVVVESATVSDGTQTPIDYAGSVETGVLIQIFVDRTLTDFTIFHSAPDSTITVAEFSAALEDGDVVSISSVSGDKYVNLLRDFDVSSILYAMTPQSGWVELQQGDGNNIRIYATGDPVPYEVHYFTRYGGL